MAAFDADDHAAWVSGPLQASARSANSVVDPAPGRRLHLRETAAALAAEATPSSFDRICRLCAAYPGAEGELVTGLPWGRFSDAFADYLLIQLETSEDPLVIRLAQAALSSRYDPVTLDYLLDRSREAAVSGLGDRYIHAIRQVRDPAATEHLAATVADARGRPFDDAEMAALGALGQAGTREAAGVLAGMLVESAANEGPNTEELAATVASLSDPQALPLLERLASCDDGVIPPVARIAAIQALGQQSGDEVVSVLHRQSNDDDPAVRAACDNALLRIHGLAGENLMAATGRQP